MEHILSVAVVLIALLQILLTVAVLPTGLWIFRANRSIGEMAQVITRVCNLMDIANGDGLGIPSICAKHSDSLLRIEKKLDLLERKSADA